MCSRRALLLRLQRRGSKAYTYKLLSLPKYVILYIKRFTKNNFFLEKNPTIVNFPVKNLELKDCMYRNTAKMDAELCVFVPWCFAII
jgi:hypothetical protein